MKKEKKYKENQLEGKQESREERQKTGSYLKQLRRDKGLSREDVVRATRISLTNIQAIEEQDYEALPADIFARGLITMYGNFLGLDGQMVMARFFEERQQKQKISRRAFNKKSANRTSLVPKRLAEPTHISSATVAAILLLLIIISFTLVCLLTGWNPFSFLKSGSGKIQTVMHSAFSVDNALGQHEIYSLNVRFVTNTWVEHTIDRQDTIREIFKAGDTRKYEALNSMELVFEKPASAVLTLNNIPLPFPEADNGHPTLRLPDDLLASIEKR